MQPTLRIFVDDHPLRPVVGVVGELDVSNVVCFDEQVRSLSGAVVTVDARYVAFIDAAGVGALVRLGDHRPLSVIASSAVSRLIGICGLESHLVPAAAQTPRTFDEAPFAVLEIGEDDSIEYANRLVAEHIGLPQEAVVSSAWSSILALGGLRRGIGEARSSDGPALASTITRGCGPDRALCWTLWPLDRLSGSRALVAIGAPA